MKHVVIPAVLILLATFLVIDHALTGNAVEQTLFKEQFIGETYPAGQGSNTRSVYPHSSVSIYSQLRGAEEIFQPSYDVFLVLAKRLDLYPIGNPDGALTKRDIEVYANIMGLVSEPDYRNDLGIVFSQYDRPAKLTYSASLSGQGFQDVDKLTRYGLPSEGDLSNFDIWPIYYNKVTGEYTSGDGKLDDRDVEFAYSVIAGYGQNEEFISKGSECTSKDVGKLFSVLRGFTRGFTKSDINDQSGEPLVCIQEGNKYVLREYSKVYGVQFDETKEVRSGKVFERNIPQGW